MVTLAMKKMRLRAFPCNISYCSAQLDMIYRLSHLKPVYPVTKKDNTLRLLCSIFVHQNFFRIHFITESLVLSLTIAKAWSIYE